MNHRSVNISINVGRMASFTRKRRKRKVAARTVTRNCGRQGVEGSEPAKGTTDSTRSIHFARVCRMEKCVSADRPGVGSSVPIGSETERGDPLPGADASHAAACACEALESTPWPSQSAECSGTNRRVPNEES